MVDLFDKCYSFNRDTEAKAAGIYPFFKAISRLDGPHVTVDGRDMIMIGSNNYLGLTTHPKVKEASLRALEMFGTSCSGSRFLNGTLEMHEELERSLARFMGKESAQVFSTGFQTNQGVIAPLLDRGDSVVIDRLVHASIIEGTRLSFGKVRRFRHNDAESLRRNLEACPKDHGVLVIVDGVYSMDGDIAHLPELIATAKEFGARVMVDDAHGLGVLGEGGRGTLEHFNMLDQADLIMGTFSKSFASLGGFITGDERVINYIKHHSRALLFSASMPPAAIAAVQAALEVVQSEPEIRKTLWRNFLFFKEALDGLGFNTGASETPIIPLIIGDDFRTALFWKRLLDDGVFTNCVLAPGVPPGTQRIRTSLMATHTLEDLEKVVEILGRAGRQLGIIAN